MALDGSSSVGLLVVQLEGRSELEQANCMVCTELGYVSVLHGIKEWSDDSEVKAQKEYLEKLHASKDRWVACTFECIFGPNLLGFAVTFACF